MSFKDILLDLRSMRRSTAIRNEDDPDKVAKILESIIKESIHVQNGGDKGFQRKSMAELKQIRRDLVAGQINAGAKTGQMTAIYSSVIDALSKVESEGSKGIQAYEKTAETLRKSIPSSDSLVSALMTANPLMGYGVKMIRDMTRSSAESRQRAKLEAAKKIALLREQEAFLAEQFKAAEEAAQNNEEATEAVIDGEKERTKADKKKRSGANHHTLNREILESIDREIKMLVDIWSDEPVDRIEESIKELARQQAEEAEKTRLAAEEAAEKVRREEELNRMDDVDTTIPSTPLPDVVDTSAVRDPDHTGGGMLSGLIGSIGKMFLAGFGSLFAAGGLLAAGGILATMLKPITGMIKFFAGIGKVAVKLAGKLLLPVAVITAIYDFFDAFFNASEWLNKPDNQISMTERISLGIANVIASIVGIFDSVLELFGIDMIDTTTLTKTIHDFFMGFPDMVMNFIHSATTYMTDLYGNVIESIKTKFDEAKKTVADAFTGVVDQVMGIFESITSTFKSVVEGIEKKFAEWKQTISDIPGIGPLFSSEPNEPIQLDQAAVDQASQDLKDLTSSTNLLRVNEGVATMVPLEPTSSLTMQQGAPTGSKAASTGVQRAELQTKPQAAPPVLVNAPQTTVNNINQGGSAGAKTTNTSNQNHKFRRLADGT